MSRAAWAAVGIPRALALGALTVYQRGLAPLLPAACRYWPSCSEYARLAIARGGLVRGGSAAVLRLLRCHPWGPGGIDPPR